MDTLMTEERRAEVKIIEEDGGRQFFLVFDKGEPGEEVGTQSIAWRYRDAETGFLTTVEALIDFSELDGRLLGIEIQGGRTNLPRPMR